MQFDQTFRHRSEDEAIKEAGLTIDLDEIARKGSMTKEEKTVAKWYGIYGSRHPGAHMARVVTPGGIMTSAQARNVARVAEKYGQGVINLTTRQAVQFHWLKVGNLADMVRGLAVEGSTSRHGCGDVTRQIAACPMAETCPHKRINVRPWAVKMQKFLGDSADLDNLPRKFKITFSGCSAACAQPYIQCLGFVAVQKLNAKGENESGFQVIVGGGMGWDPYVGQELFSFIPESRTFDVARAVAQTFRDHGDRYNRTTSRMKFVVQRNGIEQVRKWVFEHLENEAKSTDGLLTEPIRESGAAIPDRPLPLVGPTGTDGKAVVRILIPKGEIDYKTLIKFAELSERYGNQRVYTNNRQNIELHGIDPAQVADLQNEVKALGFETDGFFGIRDIVSCVGTTYCPKAVTETRALFDLLGPLVRQEKYTSIEHKVLINITGCPNSCSPYRIVDIGFRGMRIREDQGSVEGYEILIGGDQQSFGKKLGEFKKTDCLSVVETILDTFVNLRSADETLTSCVTRIGIEPFIKAVFI